MVSRTDSVSGGTTHYNWDADYQLTSIAYPDGSSTSYRYDALGRRIEVNNGGQITRYVYDGDNIHLEYDGTNTLVATYVNGLSTDTALEMVRNGQPFYYLRDGLGSITALTDAAGHVVDSYTYDSYGRQTLAGAVSNPFSFTGREFDNKSGLYYYRDRYYDPRTGTFLSEDPLATGNPYTYAHNDPRGFVDPSGDQAVVEYDLNLENKPRQAATAEALGERLAACLEQCAETFAANVVTSAAAQGGVYVLTNSAGDVVRTGRTDNLIWPRARPTTKRTSQISRFGRGTTPTITRHRGGWSKLCSTSTSTPPTSAAEASTRSEASASRTATSHATSTRRILGCGRELVEYEDGDCSVKGTGDNSRVAEGDWFAIPLRGAGWGVGRAARLNQGASTVVAYLFGPARETIPTLDDVEDLRPENAVMVRSVGGSGLRRGVWPVLGQREWSREDWPVPTFGHRDDLVEKYFERIYAEGGLDLPPTQRSISKERWEQLPPDGLHGYGVIEIHLAQALGVAEAHTPAPSLKGLLAISHRLELPTKGAAEAVAKELEVTYRVAIAPDDGDWSVIASRELTDSRGLDSEEAALRALAARHHGRYDGFERGLAQRPYNGGEGRQVHRR